jgi:hypothetical protein
MKFKQNGVNLVRKHMLNVVGRIDGVDACGANRVHVRQGPLDIGMDRWIDVEADFTPIIGIKTL